MRVADYLKLGFAGVKAHKKRAFTVAAIVGLLCGVIMAAIFVLQGLENEVFRVMLAPTGGEVVVMTNVDMTVCGGECDLQEQVEQMKTSIKRYGGESIKAEAHQTEDGVFYQLEDDVLGANDGKDGAVSVAVPLTMVAKLAGVELPGLGAKASEKLGAITNLYRKTLHQVVQSEVGKKYYIAEILPNGVGIGGLGLSDIGQKGNPLDVLLGLIQPGMSQNFVIDLDETGLDVEEMGLVFAEFTDIEAAFDYYQDEANNCSLGDRIREACGEEYKYQVMPAVSNPLAVYKNLREIWSVLKAIAVILGVVALIIMLSTYARLMGKDMKIIALYHALGATGRQIRLIYITYLLILSFMAVVFALVVGLALAVGLSLVNMTALEQAFTLGFGVETGQIWLVGWNNLILVMVPVMVLVVIMAVVFGNGNFSAKELAKKLK